MDSDRFDRLTRAAIDPTRREALRLLAAGAVGGLAGVSGLTGTGAKKKCIKNSKPDAELSPPCKKSKRCCNSGHCCDTGAGKHCFNLRNNPIFCGTTCANAVNCRKLDVVARCVDGQCVL
jgi:hypothetical protein